MAIIIQYEDCGASVKYNLHPNILRTCSQIYREASYVLYNCNTFIIAFWYRNPYATEPPLRYKTSSSLVRYGLQHGPVAFGKVSNWRIVVDSRRHFEQEIHHLGLHTFCRAICHLHPRSMEILVGPQMTCRSRVPCFSLRKVLRPFEILRKVGNACFRDATGPEVPDSFFRQAQVYSDTRPALESKYSLRTEIRDLLTGDSPAEIPFEIHNELIEYVSASESSVSVKEDIRCFIIDNIRPHDEEHEQCGMYEAFQYYESDPLFQALHSAKKAAETGDLKNFKKERAKILQILEPHYQRIALTSSKMADYVKQEKTLGGILGSTRKLKPDPPIDRTGKNHFNRLSPCERSLEGVLLLGDYLKAFSSRNIKFKSRRDASHWAKMIDLHPRDPSIADSAISRANNFLTEDNNCHYFDLFRTAAIELDSKYMQVRTDRKDLYKWDVLESPGCTLEIDGPSPRLDEMIDWTVNEPNIRPLTYTEARREGYRHPLNFATF
ncbi:hypothetical protein B0J14DRAFT_697199 [Halenospora varia]|nr:hypothetical protein B0J14DRAFT_697199 [Halenospora varia]